MSLYVVRPNAIGVPSVADRRVADPCVDDGRDAGAGALGPEAVLVVVAPDEELRARQADPLDQVTRDQHAVEGDHDAADQAVPRRPAGRRHGVDDAGPAGEADREHQPARGRPRRRRPGPRSRGRRRCASRADRQSGSGRPSSSISQTRSASALDRPAQALRGSRPHRRCCRSAGARAARHARAAWPTQPGRRAVGGARCRRPGSRRDLVGFGAVGGRAAQEVEAVEGDHHGADAAVVGHAPDPSSARVVRIGGWPPFAEPPAGCLRFRASDVDGRGGPRPCRRAPGARACGRRP